jgi:hypothetical protein
VKAFYGFGFLISSPTSSAASASQSVWLPGWLDAMD